MLLWIPISAIIVFTFLFWLMLYSRNDAVFMERDRVIEIVDKLAHKDMAGHKDYTWRYDEFRKITYEEMFYKFWKPVKSFYKNHACIKETEE